MMRSKNRKRDCKDLLHRIFSSRKGVMYTIVAVIIVLVLSSLFFTQSRRSSVDVREAVSERVRSVNTFIKNLDADSQRAAYIAGFRTFVSMEQYITSSGVPFADPSSAFRQIFLTGNYSNATSSTSFIIMLNSTFNDYLTRVQYDAASQGIVFNATVINVSLWQIDPWHVLVNYTLELNASDSRGTAQWSLQRTFTGKIPILDLRDPLFTARTYGRIQRVIKPSNSSVFVDDSGNKNDTTGLIRHFNASHYIADGRGPDMIMRFAGNISDSLYGIESLVDTDDFATQGLTPNETASIVDYLYFNGTPAMICEIQDSPTESTPTKIKFDLGHEAVYEIQGNLNYSWCP